MAYNGAMGSVITTIIAAVAVGAITGIIAGLLGVGGGTILLPLFRLVFGMSAVGITATSLFTIIPTSLSGAFAHFRDKTCVPKLGIALGLGGACTSWIGVQLAQISPSWAVMFAAAAAIAYSATTMFRKALAAPKTRSFNDKKRTPEPPPPQPHFETRQLTQGAAIGAVAGLASGYIGLGGGFLMVPMMLSFMHLPMKLTSGTSLIAIMILALPATIVQCMLGNVDYLVGIAVACGSIPGALLGARLMKYVPERTLRFAFAFFLFIGAIMLVVKEFGVLG